jgi:peptidoglycan L-alanyl-D-glutamate endopeptidase CwlK
MRHVRPQLDSRGIPVRLSAKPTSRRQTPRAGGILAVIVLAAGFALFARGRGPIAKTEALPLTTIAPATSTPAPVPTAINQNFLTQVDDCVIPVTSVYGYDLYIASGFRSYAEQDVMYAQGRTVDGHIVTNAEGGQSMHNFGFAADLADHEYGENIDYGQIGEIAAWCGLEHGDRGYTDLPHFEYRGGLSLEEFQAGMRPKPLQLPCPLLLQRANAGQALTKADLESCGAPSFAPSAAGSTPTASGTDD